MNASGIILCHNHPSGNHKPSEADITITRKLKEAGKLLEIKVLDHLIITLEGYYSFADEGLL
jgi:DNA repair protein RadC